MPVHQQQRVLPWWRVNADGSYVFSVRLGSKPVEFEKGKNAIAVPALDKVPLVIDILVTAVRNGELDPQLAHTKKPETVPKHLDETVNNLEPISKSFEEDNEAGKLDKAEEIVGVVLPTNEDPALPLNPGEEALDQPASHVAA